MRPWRPIEGGYTMGLPRGNRKRPLFRLPKVVADERGRIVLVEGEKCVLALQKAVKEWGEEALVTTWNGGGAAWKRTDWTPLTGKSVSILADANESGLKAAYGIAGTLHKLGMADLRLLAIDAGLVTDAYRAAGKEPSKEADKTDIADWIDDEMAVPILKEHLKPYEPWPDLESEEAATAAGAADAEPAEEPETWRSVEDVAHHVAVRSREDELHLRFSINGQLWLRATSTHWETVAGGADTVTGELSIRYREELFNRLADQWSRASQSGDDKGKKWTDQLERSLRERIWRNGQFRDELQQRLKLDWPEDCEGGLVDPWTVIPTAQGVVEFREIEGHPSVWESHLRPFDHTRDRHRAVAPGKPEKGSAEKFLDLMTQWVESAEEREYLQRLIGAALLGRTRRAFLCIAGKPGCGKSTFIDIMEKGLGPLSEIINRETFEPKGNHNDGLANLIENQARIAIASEAQNLRPSGDLLNALTGGDTFSTRRPNARGLIKGVIRALPIFVGETVPAIRGMTSGTMERQKVIWFKPIPTENRREINPEDYANDFLAWGSNGVRLFLENPDLTEPASIRKASEQAAAEQAPEMAWLEANRKELYGLTSREIAAKMNDALKPAKPYSVVKVGRDLGSLAAFRGRRTTGGKNLWEDPDQQADLLK